MRLCVRAVCFVCAYFVCTCARCDTVLCVCLKFVCVVCVGELVCLNVCLFVCLKLFVLWKSRALAYTAFALVGHRIVAARPYRTVVGMLYWEMQSVST